jgi:transcription antitermination factor NusA-like protein
LRRDDDGTGEFMEEIVPCTGLGPGRVIGKRGATVTRLQEETGARIEVVADDGQVRLYFTKSRHLRLPIVRP